MSTAPGLRWSRSTGCTLQPQQQGAEPVSWHPLQFKFWCKQLTLVCRSEHFLLSIPYQLLFKPPTIHTHHNGCILFVLFWPPALPLALVPRVLAISHLYCYSYRPASQAVTCLLLAKQIPLGSPSHRLHWSSSRPRLSSISISISTSTAIHSLTARPTHLLAKYIACHRPRPLTPSTLQPNITVLDRPFHTSRRRQILSAVSRGCCTTRFLKPRRGRSLTSTIQVWLGGSLNIYPTIYRTCGLSWIIRGLRSN